MTTVFASGAREALRQRARSEEAAVCGRCGEVGICYVRPICICIFVYVYAYARIITLASVGAEWLRGGFGHAVRPPGFAPTRATVHSSGASWSFRPARSTAGRCMQRAGRAAGRRSGVGQAQVRGSGAARWQWPDERYSSSWLVLPRSPPSSRAPKDHGRTDRCRAVCSVRAVQHLLQCVSLPRPPAIRSRAGSEAELAVWCVRRLARTC